MLDSLAPERATRLALALCAGLAGATPAFSAAVEWVLAPVADTTIYLADQSATNASNALGETLGIGVTANGEIRRALLRFDLGALPPGSVVHSARLTLFAQRAAGPNYDVSLHRVLSGWGEGTSRGSSGASDSVTGGDATWVKAVHPDVPWTTPGGDFVAAPSAVTFVGFAGASYAWESPGLAADVQAWVDDPSTSFGWIVIGDETVDRNAKLFLSRQSPIAPALYLQVTPVPEPSTAATLGVGIGLLAWQLARRRRRAEASRLVA